MKDGIHDFLVPLDAQCCWRVLLEVVDEIVQQEVGTFTSRTIYICENISHSHMHGCGNKRNTRKKKLESIVLKQRIAFGKKQ